MGCHFFLQDLGVYLIVNMQCIYGEYFEIIIEGTEMHRNILFFWMEKQYFHLKIFLMSVLLKLMYVLCLVAQSCPTLCDPMDCSPPGSSVSGDAPGKNTGVGCHALLQRIFPTQGSNHMAGRFFTI